MHGFGWQCDHSWTLLRYLDQSVPHRVLPGRFQDLKDPVKAQVHQVGERTIFMNRQRSEKRKDFIQEKIFQIQLLSFVQRLREDPCNTGRFQFRSEDFPEIRLLFPEQGERLPVNFRKERRRFRNGGRSHHEKFVKIRADNTEKLQSLQGRIGGVHPFRKNPGIETDPG
ncbi:MAG: hypothetical protein BWY42_01423 [Candidatus Omnitrophica bacterium ADurb.Bin277]|nr:MAG: hypothetical protein BWY42_01423 [Candidatus Omnitrophica bacterium ADurb.Bin277]